MKKTACILLLLTMALHVAAVGWKQLDSLYRCIDHAIVQSSDFIAIREARIRNLHEELDKTMDERIRLHHTLQL